MFKIEEAPKRVQEEHPKVVEKLFPANIGGIIHN